MGAIPLKAVVLAQIRTEMLKPFIHRSNRLTFRRIGLIDKNTAGVANGGVLQLDPLALYSQGVASVVRDRLAENAGDVATPQHGNFTRSPRNQE